LSGAQRNRPPLSPKEAWISDGRQVLHFRPTLWDRWNQPVEVNFGEVMADGEPPLLKRRREEALRLWAEKRQQGWQPTKAQWQPPGALGSLWATSPEREP
jgi:hypothetical protein